MTDIGGAAVVQHTADGIITTWNDASEALFGWSSAEAVGMRSDQLIPARNRERHADMLRSFVEATPGVVLRRMITASHRSGRELRIAVAFSLVDEGGALRVVMQSRAASRAASAATQQAGHRDASYVAILDQIEDGCCVVDLQGNFLFVNEAFCRLFGFTRQYILGRNFKESMGAERADKLFALYMQVYRTGEPAKSFEYQIYPQNSSAKHVEQTISLERDANGEAIGFLAIARDCTARKEAELEAARARETAEAANRAKSEFLANMSHEIRTPMSGIIGMTELALDTTLTPYQFDCLSTVMTSAESLLTILNDILDFSKIESRKLTLETVPFDVQAVMHEALKPLALRARQKKIELRCDLDPLVPAVVIGDPGRLKQIVTNLIGNAIKFTDSGEVVLSIREETRCEGCTSLRFSVRDTGVGIPADKHAAIFEAFRQADGSTTRRFGGTGLGLAISTTLVQLMGGRIWVESEPGAGSTFHFTAAFDTPASPETGTEACRLQPSAPRPVADAVGAAPAARQRAARHVNVLVAEDNLVNQRVVSGLLSNRGHTVTLVGNGHEALAALERQRFDLVLMDVQMPLMGGFDTTAAIRARERDSGAHVRIVAMTANAMQGDRERCLASGMDGYLSKPIDSQVLFAIVENDALPAMALAVSADAPIDRSELLRRLSGDRELMMNVIQVFLDTAPACLEGIQAAVSSRNAEGIRSGAHALKGAAGNLAAQGLCDAADALERLAADGRLDAAEAGWRVVSMEAVRTFEALRRLEPHA